MIIVSKHFVKQPSIKKSQATPISAVEGKAIRTQQNHERHVGVRQRWIVHTELSTNESQVNKHASL